MNLKQYEERVQAKFPQENIKVLAYQSMKKEVKIKCNDCGEIFCFKKGESVLNKDKKIFCKKCNDSPQRVRTKNKVEKWFLEIGHKKYSYFKVISFDCVEVQCIECGKISTKSFSDLAKGKGCLCSVKNRMIPQEVFEKEIFDLGYFPIEEYKGRFHKILIKHKCGFIWKTMPKNLIDGKGCPKCNKKTSKGEATIENFLKEAKIDYKREVPIKVEGKTLYCDFFLADKKMVVEYNGIQHYKPVEFYGGLAQLEKQKYNDRLKEKYCLENGLKFVVIKYTDDIISQCSTTIM